MQDARGVKRLTQQPRGRRRANQTDDRVYDPWNADPPRTEDGEPESATASTNERPLDSDSHEKPPAADGD